MAGRKLPVELLSILNSTWPRQTQPLASLARHGTRLSSTLAASAQSSVDLARSHTSKPDQITIASTSCGPPANIFESIDDDYDHIPLSSLDHPSPPRSASEALRCLLKSGSYKEANLLLADLTTSSELVAPHLAFARHARRLLEEEGPSSAWLKWWAIAPSLEDLHASARSPGAFLRESNHAHRRASKMVQTLLGMEDLERPVLTEFAQTLCRQGFAKLAARDVLPQFTAAAYVKQSERLWTTCLEAYKSRADSRELARLAPWADAVTASTVTRKARRLKQVYAQRRTAHFSERWFDAHQLDLARSLKLARAKMIRLHAGMGRLELATELALDSGIDTLGGARLPAFTFVRLLNLTALSDRFDLFTQLYEAFIADGRRLTRTQRAPLRRRLPYLARAASAGAGTPSVKEAFTTIRYASFASAIEEGGGGAEEERSFSARTGQSALLLERALQEGDVRKAGGILVRALKEKRVLPLDMAARFILLARENGLDAILDSLDELFSVQQEGTRSWMSGYWATATMLSCNKEQQWEASLATFFNLFSVDALPEQVREASNVLKNDPERWIFAPGAGGQMSRLVPDSHTFAIAIQALVPLLSQPVTSTDSDGHPTTQPSPHTALLDGLLHSLLNEKLELPLRTRSLNMSTTPKGSTQLDGYTFLPFFQLHAREKRPAVGLLKLAGDLQERAVSVPKHAWAVILGCFAAQAREKDLLFLLDLLENKPTTTSRPSASPEMLEAVDRMSWPPNETGQNVGIVAYTCILAGLQKCGEVQMAQRLRERMGGQDWRGTLDDKFSVVMQRLMRQGMEQ